ncbi:GD20663 [Drosophila simulans]|uniref:GD20663 n=1 Tax=Drosophila simulans TaxID=7240 RepID=B4QU47_DROSI|nr:GD20663 [Drosophila simulans]
MSVDNSLGILDLSSGKESEKIAMTAANKENDPDSHFTGTIVTTGATAQPATPTTSNATALPATLLCQLARIWATEPVVVKIRIPSFNRT